MNEIIERMAAQIADLRRQMSAMNRMGVVESVDPAKGTVILSLGEGFSSPPIPYSQIGGALSVHAPPSPGQQMLLLSPNGDARSGIAMPATFGGSNASPGSDSASNVLTFGGVTITLTGDGVQFICGGATVVIGSDGVTVTGGQVTHNGKNIGHDHTHSGVMSGPGNTGTPN